MLKTKQFQKKIIKKLVIIQNIPTQFDGPLYSSISINDDIDLSVIYTDLRPGESKKIDSELGIFPNWDNLYGLKYKAYFLHSTFAILRFILNIKPAHVVICGWYPRAYILLAIMLRLSGVSIGVRSDNTLMHANFIGFHGLIKRAFMYFWLGIYDSWHPVGVLSKRYLVELSALGRPIFYFPYAIDVDWFSSAVIKFHNDRIPLRAKLDIRPDDFVVVGVMKWSAREDPLTLVNSIIMASKEVERIKLILVGDGPLSSQVLKRTSEFKELFLTPGYVKYSDLPAYYAVSDLFVHPAKSEPYGVSVQEAMACGLPVIASDMVGSACDFIVPGKNGDIFPSGNSKVLAKMIVAWTNNFDAVKVAAVSRKKAEEWSYRRTYSEWKQCLSD